MMVKKRLLSGLLWLILLALPALTPNRILASAHGSQSFSLANGLKVILRKDSSSPLAALQLWVGTGAADETAEEAGLAHVLEHVLFRGSSERGTGKIAAALEGLGGRINGFTSRDHTVYHMVLPASRVSEGLRLLADMMQLPTPEEVSEPELQREIQVVLQEWKQGQDNPRSLVNSALFKTAYRVHPYGRPIIGTPESLSRITRELLSRFHRRWYGANNMALVAVGNFDIELVKGEILAHFASLPPAEPPARQWPAESLPEEQRFQILKAPVRQSHLVIGFPIPRAGDAALPALDLLAFVLGRGESSRLAERVKIAGGLVNSVSSSTFVAKDPGLFLIRAQLKPEKTSAALAAIFEELRRLQEETVSPLELNRAHINFTRAFAENKETLQGQANQLGRFQFLYGNPDYEETYLREIRRLGGERLRAVARTFFSGERFSLSLVVPEEATQLPGVEEIAGLGRLLQPPPSTAGRGERMLRAILENGLRILVEENRRVPLFTIHAGAVGGTLLEDDANNGIHSFIAGMLTQGTPRFTAMQLVQEVEQLGGSLRASSGNSSLSLSGTFPATYLERGLEIFLDALLQSTFPGPELEKKRREIVAGIDTREERARNQAFQLFYQTLFRNHPYRLRPSGEKEQVLRLGREELLAHYRSLLASDRMVLTVVGDVDGEKVLRHLQAKLSALPKSASALSLPSAENDIDGARVARKIARTKQAHVVFGFPAPAKGEPDYFAGKVLETILSRIGGRLFVELRDRLGLAYSVGAFSLDDPFQGAFGIYAATEPASVDKIKEAMIEEIRRLQEEEVSSQELERAKNYLLGNYLIARQSNASRAADLALNELFDLGSDFGRRYQEEVEKVSAAAVRRFARRHLPLDRHIFTTLGP